ILLVFARDFPAHSSKFIEEFLPFFWLRRLAVPAEITLYLTHALAGDGVRDDDRRLFVDGIRLIACRNELRDVVAVDLKHVPVEGFVFVTERLERHYLFGHTVYLDVVPVDDGGEIREPILPSEHCRLPKISLLMLAIRHRAENAELLLVHASRIR